ncbi:Chorion peroxidase [Nymphon striatum]|nr:Chorion peroxidase [Nymphon striatum]
MIVCLCLLIVFATVNIEAAMIEPQVTSYTTPSTSFTPSATNIAFADSEKATRMQTENTLISSDDVTTTLGAHHQLSQLHPSAKSVTELAKYANDAAYSHASGLTDAEKSALLNSEINQVDFGTSGLTNPDCSSCSNADSDRYRTASGSCNNVNNCNWGTPTTTFRRILSATYDGNGNPTSNTVTPFQAKTSCFGGEDLLNDRGLSVMVMQWGQYIAHDISATPIASLFNADGKPLEVNCCNNPEYPHCLNFQSATNCHTFIRSAPGLIDRDGKYSYGQREQMNMVTAFIDGSPTYGSTTSDMNGLRQTTSNGTLTAYLKTWDKNTSEFPPTDADQYCGGKLNEQKEHKFDCFVAGIPFLVCKLLHHILFNLKYRIRQDSLLSASFQCDKGTPQGDPLSPLLFSLFLADLPDYLDFDGLSFPNSSVKIHLLMYADDIVLLAEDANQLQTALDCRLPKCSVSINGHDLERVPTFVYLGIVFTPQLSFTKHIERCVSKANARLDLPSSLAPASVNFPSDIPINCLLYADDTCLIADTADELQLSLDSLTEYCKINHLIINVSKSKVVVFHKGDTRPNIHLGMMLIHTLLLREHNAIVAKIEESLDSRGLTRTSDEVFNEARRILGAFIQVITFEQYLPLILGPDLMTTYELNTENRTSYSSSVDPSVFNSFATAAFRMGHSQIYDNFKMAAHLTGVTTNPIQLSQLYFNPDRPNEHSSIVVRRYVLGMIYEAANAVDKHFIPDISEPLMFQSKDRNHESRIKIGLDLAALNIQRGRDHGLPKYSDWKNYFDQFDSSAVSYLADSDFSIYGGEDNADLYVAGMLESHLANAEVGKTFGNIIALQFRHFMYGDRYFYNHNNVNSAHIFNEAQIAELKKIKISQMICKNADLINASLVTDDVFHTVSDSNLHTTCKNVLPNYPDIEVLISEQF